MQAYEKILKALADSSRRELFELVVQAPAHTVALAQHLPLSQPAISQHLKVLLEAGLVEQQSQGRRTLYSAVPGAIGHLREYLARLTAGEPSSAPPVSLADDSIALASRQWAAAWPGQDANIYAVTMRLLLMGRGVERALKETAERHGLQGSELLLLDTLQLAPDGALTASKLQQRLGVSKGAVTKLVLALEARGLVIRTACARDRRVTFITLTQAAHQTLSGILDRHEYGADHAAAKRMGGPQLAQLAELLQQYHRLMAEEALVVRKKQ